MPERLRYVAGEGELAERLERVVAEALAIKDAWANEPEPREVVVVLLEMLGEATSVGEGEVERLRELLGQIAALADER